MTAPRRRLIANELCDQFNMSQRRVAPGSPWQNGYAESFHSKVRDEFLNREEFESEPQARALGALWREEYNTERPHSSLDYQTPAEFAATCERYVPIDEDLPDPSSSVPTNR